MMVGREMANLFPSKDTGCGDVLLEVNYVERNEATLAQSIFEDWIQKYGVGGFDGAATQSSMQTQGIVESMKAIGLDATSFTRGGVLLDYGPVTMVLLAEASGKPQPALCRAFFPQLQKLLAAPHNESCAPLRKPDAQPHFISTVRTDIFESQPRFYLIFFRFIIRPLTPKGHSRYDNQNKDVLRTAKRLCSFFQRLRLLRNRGGTTYD